MSARAKFKLPAADSGEAAIKCSMASKMGATRPFLPRSLGLCSARVLRHMLAWSRVVASRASDLTISSKNCTIVGTCLFSTGMGV